MTERVPRSILVAALGLLGASAIGDEKWAGVFAPYPGARRVCAYRAYDDLHDSMVMDPPSTAAFTETTYYATKDTRAAVAAFYREHHDGAAAATGKDELLASSDGERRLLLTTASVVRGTCKSVGKVRAGERGFVAVSEHHAHGIGR